MTNETIGVTVTFKEPVTFHLRMIGVNEETALRQKMFGKTEAEREAESYQNNVNMLADLSENPPTGMFPNKPEKMTKSEQAASDKTFIEDFSSAKEAINHFFKEKSVIKERIAEYAVRGYFIKLAPDLSFS